MSILVSILLSDITFRMIKLSDVYSSKIEKSLKELTSVLMKELLLILMSSDLSFEFIDMLLVFLFLGLFDFFVLDLKC